MIFLLVLSALMCCIPTFSFIIGNVAKKNAFILNIIFLAIGCMILSIPVGLLFGKMLYYLTH